MTVKKSGIILAAAVAALVSTTTFAQTPSAPSSSATVHCAGVNSCKGQGACKSSSNACKGLNSCKGTGWTATTAANCQQQGGTVTQ